MGVWLTGGEVSSCGDEVVLVQRGGGARGSSATNHRYPSYTNCGRREGVD